MVLVANGGIRTASAAAAVAATRRFAALLMRGMPTESLMPLLPPRSGCLAVMPSVHRAGALWEGAFAVLHGANVALMRH